MNEDMPAKHKVNRRDAGTTSRRPIDRKAPRKGLKGGKDAPAFQRLSSGNRKSLVIQAARRLFALQTYERTRMEEIAAAAGCTTGPVYHFFKTKRAVFHAAVQSAVTDASSALTQIRNAHPELGPLTRLMLSCDRLLDLLNLKEAPAFSRDAPRVLGFDEWREMLDRTWLPMFVGDLRAAMIAGEVEPEPPEPLAALLIWSIVTVSNHVVGGTPRSAEMVERYRSCIHRMILRLKLPVPAA
jgi:AcrR family transcriptional regulator